MSTQALLELIRNPCKIKTTSKRTIVFDNNEVYFIDGYYFVEHTILRESDNVSDFSFKFVGNKPESVGIKFGNRIIFETDDSTIDLEIPLIALQFQKVSLFAKFNQKNIPIPQVGNLFEPQRVLNVLKSSTILVDYNQHYFDRFVRQQLALEPHILKDKDDTEIVSISSGLGGSEKSKGIKNWKETKIVSFLGNIYSEDEERVSVKIDNLRRGSFCSEYNFSYNKPETIRLFIGGKELYKTKEFDLTIPFVNLQYHEVSFVLDFKKSKCKFNKEIRFEYKVDETFPSDFDVDEPAVIELPDYPQDILLVGGMGGNCPKKGTKEFNEKLLSIKNKNIETERLNKELMESIK